MGLRRTLLALYIYNLVCNDGKALGSDTWDAGRALAFGQAFGQACEHALMRHPQSYIT